jgi:hypothetical protein
MLAILLPTMRIVKPSHSQEADDAEQTAPRGTDQG